MSITLYVMPIAPKIQQWTHLYQSHLLQDSMCIFPYNVHVLDQTILKLLEVMVGILAASRLQIRCLLNVAKHNPPEGALCGSSKGAWPPFVSKKTMCMF